MNKKELLEKLEELYDIKEIKEGFPSQQAYIDYCNKVAPLLNYGINNPTENRDGDSKSLF